jgi:heme-degrading monooxygenase HmoA
MEQVVIDYFTVPADAKEEFLRATRRVQSFLKTLPGYVDGYLYEKRQGQSPYNVMTTATWENAEAVEKTKSAVRAEFQRQGLDPQEMMRRLEIETVRSIYSRQAY